MVYLTQGMLRNIEMRDHIIMRHVHRWRAPRWVRLWMLWATRGGDGWLWFALGVLLLAVGGQEGRQATLQAFLAAGLGIALFMSLKRVTGRRRPCALEPHCWSTLLPPDQFSFPSGHTITAVAVSVPLASYYPEAAPALFFCALSIAVSRILLGMHFLSDVVVGVLLGGGVGWFVLSVS